MNKKRLGIDSFLAAIIVLSIVRQFFLGNYHNMFIGILTLVLFFVPMIIEKRFNFSIPIALETIILTSIFSAQILGEVHAFYIKVPIFDSILHMVNGFSMAAIGFALIDMFNRSEKFSTSMSPYFVAFTAFCFSMTMGVIWEMFEFSMDRFFFTDMQKDWILPIISSVKLNPDGTNIPIKVAVDSVVVDGQKWNLGGYLDIGLVDTMKDLMVNFIGAVIFSVIGIAYLKHEGKGKIAASLIPVITKKDKSK